MVEILALRSRFAKLMAFLLWGHVPLVIAIAWGLHQSPAIPATFAIALALVYQLSWWYWGIGPSTRYVSAVALMGEPALLVYLLMGNPWQVDMHMYFFAAMALLIAWCDWRVIALASVAILLHHLTLDLLLPLAVFPNGADVSRVLFHAVVVALEGAVLIWLSETLFVSFRRVEKMSQEIQRQNDTLEETVAERTQEAQAASVAKSLFLANMSHEIRTPMNAILGFSHLTLRTELNTKQRGYLLKIKSASSNLLSLINDILDFSKIEAGKLALESTPFSLRSSLETVRGLLTLRALERGLDLQFDIPPEMPDNLLGDPLRLNQVVTNLLSNAIKFTEAGEVSLSIRALSQQKDNVLVELSVRDSGIGMTSNEMDQLFTAFSQADASTTRRFGGTGLGLSISRQLVELMGGKLSVTSEVGVGSTFSFTAAFGVNHGAVSPSSLSVERLGRLRVLVVDDNAASREIFRETFATWSIAVELAASGAEALSTLRSAALSDRPFDLVLLDWRMPGMDGIEAARRIRDDPSIPRAPAVMMVSAYSREEATAEAEAVGIAAFLTKPLDSGVLLETLGTLFGSDETQASPGQITVEIPVVPERLRGSIVLLVEDNEINREVAFEILTDAGLIVETAENGRIACEMVVAAGSKYSAVLMDVQMPEMDGIEATRRIREIYSAADLPIIAMTAHAYAKERDNCLNAGMNDHAAKPVEPALLIKMLSRWLIAKNGKRLSAVSTAVPDALWEDLPTGLPPFDLPAALTRLNGKRKLLRKLIVDFGRKFDSAVLTLREQIAEGRWDEGRRLAHTIKGVAGALEINRVAAAARELEDGIAKGAHASLSTLLNRLDEAMSPAIAAAQSLDLQPATALAAPALLRAVTLDYSDVGPVLAELRQLLQRRSLRARKAFEAIEVRLGDSPEGQRLQPVRQALMDLDFSRAIADLDRLTAPVEPMAERFS
jgi:two-component system, sensor histidine kinase and response regulator